MQENNGSFIIPPNLWQNAEDRQAKINVLTELVYRSYSLSDSKTVDSITKAYNKAFEELPNLRNCQLLLKTSHGLDGPQWEMSEDSTASGRRRQVVPHMSGLLKGSLEIEGYRTALCHPLDKTQPIILKGLKNWKGALNE